MIELNTSKAQHYKKQFELFETFSNPNLNPYNKDAFRCYTNNSKLLETRIRYINESRHDISVIDASGFTIDIPAENGIRERLLICVTLQWGKDCVVNLKALQAHMKGADQKTIDSILSQITTRPIEYGTRELTFYYSVDLSDIESDPYGIWIENINTQIVSTPNAHKTTFFTKDAFYNYMDTLYATSELIYTTNLNMSYFTNERGEIPSVFIPVGNDAIEVKPVYHPSMRKGIYINLSGDARFVADKMNKNFLYLAPEDFREYGIYDSYRDFLDSVMGAKTGDRKHLERLLKTFKRYHRTLGDEDEDYLNLKEVKLFGSLTIGDFFELITEVNKLDSLLDKMFKKK